MIPAVHLLAQTAPEQPADNTGDRIRLIIYGLIAVAVLLAAFTVWYWRHTDPARRRLRERAAEPMGAARPLTPIEQSIVSPPPNAGAPVDQPDVIDDDGADEWLRLTGPQSLER